jgi:pyridinium-3,5-biscarboxylic acid mononucleotide synthase
MTEADLQRLLEEVRTGAIDAAAASNRIRQALTTAPFEDLGFARVDTHRTFRQGFPEVVLGLGKSPAQIAAIAERIVATGQSLLVTRANPDAADAVRAVIPGSR